MTKTSGGSGGNSEIFNFLNSRLENYLKILEQMIGINSATGNAAGVNELGQLTASLFSPLGFSSRFVDNQTPNFGKHLILTRAGTSDKKLGLISHLDTVYPEQLERENNFIFRIEGDKIYGPGSCDIKGGTLLIYMLVETLAKFSPEMLNSVNLQILLDASEENQTLNFSEIAKRELSGQAIAALVFEADYNPSTTTDSPNVGDQAFHSSMVCSRKGLLGYHLHAQGREAHAGSKHPDGINAIREIADKTLEIQNLTNYELGITANVGLIRGGSAENVVPGSAEINFEVRCINLEDFANLERQITKLCSAAKYPSAIDQGLARLTLSAKNSMQPWPKNPGTERLCDIWRSAAKDANFTIEFNARGGLSDGNRLWQFVDTIDGLGPQGANAHCAVHDPARGCYQESAKISSLTPKTILNYIAVKKLLA